MAEVLQKRSASVASLPENLLLEILGYLPVKDLCTIGRVNRQWRRIARDNRLWRHVNLLPYKLNLQRTWRLIRAHFSDVLLTLRLRGYMDPAGVSWKKSTLSDAMLRDLLERCPNMATLELHQTNLTNVAIDNLPNRLVTLIITSSMVTPGWFQALTTSDKVLTHLKVVDLSHSSKTNNTDVKHLCARPSITTLKLNGCYRVTDEGFKVIAEKLTNLEELCLAETGVTPLALHHISRHLTSLRRLDLSRCKQVTDGAVGSVVSGLASLNWLSVAQCSQLTNDGVKQLEKLKQLKHLDVSDLNAPEQSAAEQSE